MNLSHLLANRGCLRPENRKGLPGAASDALTNFGGPGRVVISRHQRSLSSTAKTLAAVREETPSLAKMF